MHHGQGAAAEERSAPVRAASQADPHRTYKVTIVTNCGTFAFTLDVTQSPKTSASFYYLVKRGFFDGVTFHRVASGFVIQGGDPTGTGAGGPGYTVVEPPPKSTQYVLGDVAMAKTGSQPSGRLGEPVLHRDRRERDAVGRSHPGLRVARQGGLRDRRGREDRLTADEP